MALHVVLGVGGSEVTRRTLEHRLRHVALANMAGQLGAVDVLLAEHTELECVGIRLKQLLMITGEACWVLTLFLS